MRYFDIDLTPTTHRSYFESNNTFEDALDEEGNAFTQETQGSRYRDSDPLVSNWYKFLPKGYSRSFDVNGFPILVEIPLFSNGEVNIKGLGSENLTLDINGNFYSHYIETPNITQDGEGNDIATYLPDLVAIESNNLYLLSVEAEIELTKLVNEQAQVFRFDDMKSARAASGVPLSGSETTYEVSIRDDALALAKWDRAVWAKSLDLEGQIKSGTLVISNVDEFMALIPAFV